MVVETDPAALPLGIFVGQRWQRSERGFVKLLKKSPPAGAPAAHQAIVQLIEQSTDRSVELGQREEASMPQPCQDPTPDDLNADFNLGLVARLVGTRRNNGGAVMPRHVGIEPAPAKAGVRLTIGS